MKVASEIFKHKKPFTIGVEEEYMLCDPETGDLINKADEIIDNLMSDLKPRYSYELIESEIEVNTSVCYSVGDAIEEIAFLRKRTKELGELLNKLSQVLLEVKKAEMQEINKLKK